MTEGIRINLGDISKPNNTIIVEVELPLEQINKDILDTIHAKAKEMRDNMLKILG